LIRAGYDFHLVFLWLSSADLAVERVRSRVGLGGHSVPQPTIRRRYAAGLRNFFTVYRPMATTWRLYDNSGTTGPRLVAEGRGSAARSVRDRAIWVRISEEWTR
jgi:predicted ABC-type ATPase